MTLRKLLGTLFIFALFAGGYYLYHYFKEDVLQYPTFIKLEKVRFRSFSPPPDLSFRLRGDMLLHNPNPFGLEIEEVDLDIIVDGKKSTTVSQELEAKMPAKSDFRLSLEFDVPLKDKNLLGSIGDFFTGAWKKRAIEIQYIGELKIKTLKLPITIPVDFRSNYLIEDYLENI